LTNRKADECHLLYFWQIPNFIIIFIDSHSHSKDVIINLYINVANVCVYIK
jgi:hypothetical protein